MDDNLEIIEKATPPKNRCIIIGSAIEEKYKIFINYLTIAKALKHGLEDTMNEMGGILVGSIYSDKRIDDDFLYVDIKSILPVARVGVQKKFTFSEEELERLEEEVKEKYPDDMVVGWYHSHPGWGVELSEDDQDTNISFFNDDWNVLLLVESVAKDFAVFKTDENLQKAIQSKGYVIYCDTNDDIPKMKKLVDMVEQNRERKKDKGIKMTEKPLEEQDEGMEEGEEQDFYLATFHPKVIITVLASIIIVLIVVLAVGKTKMDKLKNSALYKQGSFSIETKEPQKGIKEVFMEGDFINETIKIVVSSDGAKEKWNVKEIYVKKGESPFQLVARLEVPTPVPIADSTPVLSSTPSGSTGEVSVTPSVTPTALEKSDEEIIKEHVKDWVAAWKSGDVDKFKSFYAKDFSNSTNDLDKWIDKKVADGIFKGNPQVDIVKGEITVNVISDDKIEAKFEQYFNGSFVSNGQKILTFSKQNGEWLITGEEFKP